MPMFGWSMGIEGWLFMGGWVLVLAILVWALVREPRRAKTDDALDILRARFAHGEIDADEFARALELLKAQPFTQEGVR